MIYIYQRLTEKPCFHISCLELWAKSINEWRLIKPRKRVLAALAHEPLDRCPMQISFTPEFASRLKKEMGLTESDLHNPYGGGNTYRIERELGEDMLLTSIGWANSNYRDEYTKTGMTYVDDWGITWKSVAYDTPMENFWAMVKTIHETPCG